MNNQYSPSGYDKVRALQFFCIVVINDSRISSAEPRIQVKLSPNSRRRKPYQQIIKRRSLVETAVLFIADSVGLKNKKARSFEFFLKEKKIASTEPTYKFEILKVRTHYQLHGDTVSLVNAFRTNEILL